MNSAQVRMLANVASGRCQQGPYLRGVQQVLWAGGFVQSEIRQRLRGGWRWFVRVEDLLAPRPVCRRRASAHRSRRRTTTGGPPGHWPPVCGPPGRPWCRAGCPAPRVAGAAASSGTRFHKGPLSNRCTSSQAAPGMTGARASHHGPSPTSNRRQSPAGAAVTVAPDTRPHNQRACTSWRQRGRSARQGARLPAGRVGVAGSVMGCAAARPPMVSRSQPGLPVRPRRAEPGWAQ